MAAPENLQSALGSLEEGDFDHAWDLYGRLVELFPEDLEYACGFYASGYWKNRSAAVLAEPAGRARGSFLFREWDRFAALAAERDFEGCLSFRAIMRQVLGSAASELRAAFQSESGRSVDSQLLLDLGICLIRIEDYPNAADILRYTIRLRPGDARAHFLLGEALCSAAETAQVERGLAHYRDAFLLEADSADPTLIASDPAAAVFRELLEEFEQDLDRATVWFPARLSARSFGVGMRPIAETAAVEWSEEVRRLESSLVAVVPKFRDRVRARMAFLLLELLRLALQLQDRGSVEEAEELLRNLAPETYAAYRAHRRKG